MRKVTDIHEWRDALERLAESCMGQAGMEYGVLPILLNSYDQLGDTMLKGCFLHCSLYPEDCHIPRGELIENFISEKLVERSNRSFRAEIDLGHAILNQLERVCLLERTSNGTDVKMHVLIRDMVIGIAKDNPRYMVKAGLHLREIPDVQEWTEDLDKVSLMDNSIKEISPGTFPKCPGLSTLILSGNPLKRIPDCFFAHMCGLRTLNLSLTKIQNLPNSISDLENLRTLLLKFCNELESMPSLEKLKELRHLVFNCVQMEEIIEDDKNEGGNISSADITFPRLLTLHLRNLPQLKSICKVLISCDSIRHIHLEGIKRIKKVPLYLQLLDGQPSPPPSLILIWICREDKEWWESLDWDHHNANSVLEHLKVFDQTLSAHRLVKECLANMVGWDSRQYQSWSLINMLFITIREYWKNIIFHDCKSHA
ncbi:unnamed protein product [Fraxinus pennsylvanica]|uniref:Disease resistance protein winged helix domain-containing protein n=1 Tax=Fraxinus pennsylvanica TaxID=56036 RepID=A0AAD2DMV7_9LAMI|nr:unnamed protein product [Fraxinus pennsylvanica]